MAEAIDIRALNEKIERQSAFVTNLMAGMDQTIVGQKHLIESLLIGLLSDGHILLEGVPGLAKTLAIKTLASLIDAKYSRIQFTPDLLPADVIGTMIYSQKDEQFIAKRGPIFFQLRIVDDDLQHETVYLCFRKWISTFLFNRVLCSHYEERFRQVECFLAQCYLTFLHRFEQSTLYLSRSTVDFIRQYEVCKDRTALSDELFILLAINHGTDNVGREQVRSKLDTAIFSIDE